MVAEMTGTQLFQQTFGDCWTKMFYSKDAHLDAQTLINSIKAQRAKYFHWLTSRATSPLKAGCWFVDGDDLTGALHAL